MQHSRYWTVREDWRVAEQLYALLGARDGVRLDNHVEIFRARHPLFWSMPTGNYANPVIPADFIRPRLCMPSRGFAPDYLVVGQVTLVSRRLRDALGQPRNVIQYVPVEIRDGGVAVHAQDYQWINILACHPAIDMACSQYAIRDGTNYRTKERFHFIHSYTKMVLREDIDPGAEIFRVADDLVTVLATDALAERVMRAGCTGIAFEDPATHRSLGLIHRYRTATGIVEEDMEKILPPIR